MTRLFFVLVPVLALHANVIDIRKDPVHLRSGAEREWEEFPEAASGPALRLMFQAEANDREYALSLRQRDVKRAGWKVRINGQTLGALNADEREMWTIFAVPPRTLRSGTNEIEIAAEGAGISDDIMLRDLRLFPRTVRDLLRESTISVEVKVDGERGPAPVRVTIVDSEGTLVPFAPLGSRDREATRTGVIYTAGGVTRFGVPAGHYRIFASRGWEYTAPSRKLQVNAGRTEQVRLRLKREVRLANYVSCDTHVHTLELSGHGDASVRERLITAAGEGLDLIVATEHNQTADYASALRSMGLEPYLAAVRGNEVTTALGHFNVFPLEPAAPSPASQERDWKTLERSIRSVPGARVIVQNHPRDLHLGYRPFDSAHHLSSVGENLKGRPFFANAMEVVNSGAMHSNILQPVLDWLGLLNRGIRVAAIGASDTHTVDFVPIGQARTYIDVRRIKGEWKQRPETVFERLANGENLVAYGLAADLRARQRTSDGKLLVEVTVYGPSWSAADHVTLYANGFAAVDRSLRPTAAAGRKWSERIELDAPRQDLVLVAVATGPGVRLPFWEVRKPYQPVGKRWEPRVIGISKAVRLDTDGSGWQSALDYARRILENHRTPGPRLIDELGRYDASVAAQLLSLLVAAGSRPEESGRLFETGGEQVKKGYSAFLSDWKKTGR